MIEGTVEKMKIDMINIYWNLGNRKVSPFLSIVNHLVNLIIKRKHAGKFLHYPWFEIINAIVRSMHINQTSL